MLNIKPMNMRDPKGFIDTTLAKAVSRKLLVWLTAGCLLYADKLTSEDWVTISLVYLGSQAIIDGIAKWRQSGN